MDSAHSRSFENDSRVAHAEANLRLREQQKIDIGQFVARTEKVRRIANNRGKTGRSVCKLRRDRIERICEQRVVPSVLVATEHGGEVIPLVLTDAQSGHILGISAIAEIAEVQPIEEYSLMVQGSHFSAEVEQSRTLLQVHKSIVSLLAAANVRETVAEFHRLLDVVISSLNAFWFWLLGVRAPGPRERENRDEEQEGEVRTAAEGGFAARSNSVHRPTPHGLKNTLLVLEPWMAT